jgi:nucleotidyltransferase/DNA polymerase involved in DNA repair
MPSTRVKMVKGPESLAELRNVGPATLADFKLLGIESVRKLAGQDADELYVRLCIATGSRHDPCVHDTFAAAIHEARTGESLSWWAFTPLRKQRQAQKKFPIPF